MTFGAAVARCKQFVLPVAFWLSAVAIGAVAFGGGVFLGESAAPSLSDKLPANSVDAPLAAQSGS